MNNLKTSLALILLLAFSVLAFSQNNFVQIKNRWKGTFVHCERGKLELGKIDKGWWSAQWTIEPVAGTNFVKIKNRWKSTYIHCERGGLELGKIDKGWWSAQWTLERVPGTDFVKIKNRWKGTYIHCERGKLELGTIDKGWWSAQWTIKANQFQATATPPTPPQVQGNPYKNRKFPYRTEDREAGSDFTKNDNPHGWIYQASKSWMAYLPDNTKLKDISIPGTHDSGARYGGLAAEAQSWTITEQLKAGVRFLDIRCRRTKTSFAIHHGPFFQKQMFGDVMNEVTAFLRTNPTETVIMRVKEEHSAEDGSNSFQQIWDSYANRYKQYLYDGTNSNATLGSARGKVFVMCQASCSGHGMSYNSDTQLQDRYKVYWFAHKQTKGSDWATLPSKKDEVKKYINLAQSSSNWVLNHLSGAVGMAPPDVARSTNGMTYEYLASRSGKRKLGIIIMDFPGEKLIYRILKSNFDYRTACNCPAKKFRSTSAHSWVEFRLPQGNGDQTIQIKGGAYNNYVFPKCNRVYWSDLTFKCNPASCKWEKVIGSWDADALCHGSKGNSPYVFAGDK